MTRYERRQRLVALDQALLADIKEIENRYERQKKIITAKDMAKMEPVRGEQAA